MMLKILITVVLFSLLIDVRHTNAFKFNILSGREPATNRPSPVTVEFSTSVWIPGEIVKVSVKTGDLSFIKHLNKYVNVIIDLFFNEVHGRGSLSDTKYHHQGKIMYWKNDTLESNNEYSVSLEVPKYLKDGDHTFVFAVSQYINEFTSQQILFHSIGSIKVRNPQKLKDVSHGHLQSSVQVAPAHSNPLSLDVAWNTVSKLTSLSDVCNYCRSPKAIQEQCNALFRLPFPKEFQLPLESKEFGGLKDQAPLTTLDVCKFGSFEDQIRHFQFKYNNLIPLHLRNPEPVDPIKLINQNVINIQKHVAVQVNSIVSHTEKIAVDPPNRPRLRQLQSSPAIPWAHPNVLGLFKTYYSQLSSQVELEIGYIFGGSKREVALAAYQRSNYDFDEALIRIERLKILPKTYHFKIDLVEAISFEKEDGNLVLMGADSLGSTAILLENVLLQAKPRYLKEWKTMRYPIKIEILDDIISW